MNSATKRAAQRLKKYRCGTCARAYVTQSALDSHQDTKCKRRSLLHCPHCDRSFGSPFGLNYHTRLKHKNTGRRNNKAFAGDNNITNDIPVPVPVPANYNSKSLRTSNLFSRSSPVDRNLSSTSPDVTLPDHPERVPVPTPNPKQQQQWEQDANSNSSISVPSDASNYFADSEDSRNDSEEDSSWNGSVVEPIGDLILCSFCEEKFYGIEYLNNHLVNEHLERPTTGTVRKGVPGQRDRASSPLEGLQPQPHYFKRLRSDDIGNIERQ